MLRLPKAKGHTNTAPLRIMALEPRFMFDGAAAVDAAQATDSSSNAPAAPAAVDVRTADPAKTEGRKEVAFVDTSVGDYQTLESGVRDGVAIVEISGGQSGLAQMAAWAIANQGFDAIHILSHGSQGAVRLGTDQIDDQSLSADVTAQWAAIGNALTSDGDLLLYGCAVGDGDLGQDFVSHLANLTGADVAASTDATGSATLGGDWALESAQGTVETTPLAIADYDHLLGTAASLDLNGAGGGTDNTVTLAAAANGLAASTATVDDPDDAWDGGTLTVQRVTAGGAADGNLNDIFSFGSGVVANRTITRGQDVNDGTLTISGTQIGTWTYTSSTGCLSITFDSDAHNSHVQTVARAIGYSNATPYGTATVRFALNDGDGTTNADVSVTSSTIYVDQTTYDADGDGADGFNLAEALAKAVDGDTVKIQAGTYRGQFRASTAVTIESSGNGTVTLEAPNTADMVASAQAQMNNWTRYAILDLRTSTPDSGTVTVRNITVDGRYQAVATGASENLIGIAAYNTNVVISGVTTQHTAAPLAGNGDYDGNSENYGILVEAQAAYSISAVIENSTINTFQKMGITAWGGGLDITIRNNTITAVGVLGVSNQNGMQIGSSGARSGTVAHIYGNTISNIGSNDSVYSASGILMRQTGASEIYNNTFSSTGTPVFGGATTGISLYEMSIGQNIHDNTFTQICQGILVESPWDDSISGSHTFSNNDVSATYTAVIDSHGLSEDFPAAVYAANAETITVNSSATINNGRGFLAYDLYDGADIFTDTGAAANHVDGGDGNDTITTGSGNDRITGGGGNDTFVLSAADVVTDFTNVRDKLLVAGAVVPSNRVTVADSGPNALISVDTDGVGGADLTITLNGLAGLTASDLHVSNDGTDTTIIINHVPVATGGTLAASTARLDTNYSYALPNGTFTDGDSGETLTYTATGLPGGLSINANSGTISGSPSALGDWTVTITATDSRGATVTKTMTLSVISAPATSGGTQNTGSSDSTPTPPTNPVVPKVDPTPEIAPPPPNTGESGDKGGAALRTIVRDTAKTESLTVTTGNTVSADSLSQIASSLTSSTTTGSGTTTGTTSGTASVAPIGGDSGPTAIGQTFQVAVAVRSGGGDALVVNAPMRDTVVAEGTRIAVTIPTEAFAHTRADAVVTLLATRADGAALPNWMVFNPQTGTFEGTPPPGFKGEVSVKVIARDKDGREAVQTFKIVVGAAGQGNVQPDGPAPDKPPAGDRQGGTAPVGKFSLGEQLKTLGQQGRQARQMAFIDALKRGGRAA